MTLDTRRNSNFTSSRPCHNKSNSYYSEPFMENIYQYVHNKNI